MSPDPNALGSDIILGPLALLGFITAAIGYAAREYRKAREARVEDLQLRVTELRGEVEEARADATEIDRKLDEANAQIRDLKETKMRDNDALHARLVKAREMLIERGVAAEDLP